MLVNLPLELVERWPPTTNSSQKISATRKSLKATPLICSISVSGLLDTLISLTTSLVKVFRRVFKTKYIKYIGQIYRPALMFIASGFTFGQRAISAVLY